LLQK
jgi:UDP-glucuronate decarboxylase